MSILKGRHLVVTGKVPGYNRAGINEYLTDTIGAIVQDEVDHMTSIVIVANLYTKPANSKKYREAVSRNKFMISVEEMLKIIQGDFETIETISNRLNWTSQASTAKKEQTIDSINSFLEQGFGGQSTEFCI